MESLTSKFIRGSLSDCIPPANPLLKSDWAALAFDRNRYEDLAPSNVWNALLEIHSIRSNAADRIGVISFSDLLANRPETFFPATIESLRNYWSEDAHFLLDHYVFSPSFEWLVRLDQDVTLISGEAPFIRHVVAAAGGRQSVMAKMRDDFMPGESDAAGLGRYLELITKGLYASVQKPGVADTDKGQL